MVPPAATAAEEYVSPHARGPYVLFAHLPPTAPRRQVSCTYLSPPFTHFFPEHFWVNVSLIVTDFCLTLFSVICFTHFRSCFTRRYCGGLVRHHFGGRFWVRFCHILVDEFQDTNFAQFELLKLLTPPQDNLFVVGDDWQAIYSWRGAMPENIIEFSTVFPQAVTIMLEQNYRSTETIVKKSNKLISHNRMRTKKRLWTSNPEGKRVEIFEAQDQDHEAFLILEEVKSLVKGGSFTYRDVAILYRTNAQSRSIEDACIEQGIPYVIIGSTGFYAHKEVRDVISYLRLIHDTNDDEALKRIINVPPRYLGKDFVRELECKAISLKYSLFDCLDSTFARPYMNRKAIEFRNIILELMHFYTRADTTLPELLHEIRSMTGYDRYIGTDDEAPDNSTLQNLKELQDALVRFETIEDFLVYVEEHQRPRGKSNENRVNFMTLHKSKGSEYRVVFLAGCSQGLLPHYRALENGEIEEERRLCYVGMTRARERLYLSYPGNYHGRGMVISQFVREAFPGVQG